MVLEGHCRHYIINTEKKGGTLLIMLQQFRRAIGVQIVRGNAVLKMSRNVTQSQRSASNQHEQQQIQTRHRKLFVVTVNTQLLATTHSSSSEMNTVSK